MTECILNALVILFFLCSLRGTKTLVQRYPMQRHVLVNYFVFYAFAFETNPLFQRIEVEYEN